MKAYKHGISAIVYHGFHTQSNQTIYRMKSQVAEMGKSEVFTSQVKLIQVIETKNQVKSLAKSS